MILGVHSATFVKNWSEDITPYIKLCSDAGYSSVEVSLLGQNEKSAIEIGKLSKDLDINITCTTGLSKDEDITSNNQNIRKRGKDKLIEAINLTSLMGSKILSGVIHCAWGISDDYGKNKSLKYKNSSNTLKGLTNILEDEEIKLGIEPLNRYETDFINTVNEGLELCSMINHSHVGLLLDVYHMNIEEKDMCASILKANDKIFHFHVAENDRGIPGSGELDFNRIFETLNTINYCGNITLEMFIQSNQETSKDLFTWRNIEDNPFDAIQKSYKYLKNFIK